MRRNELTPYGKKICKRLIDKNMTQVELASQLGCRTQYITQILNGKTSGRKYRREINRILDIRQEVEGG